nr:MAG TPA: hypothetical protein [Caudoviricetes sp.]
MIGKNARLKIYRLTYVLLGRQAWCVQWLKIYVRSGDNLPSKLPASF